MKELFQKLKAILSQLTIYRVSLLYSTDDMVVDDFYFLFYRSAKRFVEKHEQELSAFHLKWIIGGEPLYFF